MHLLRFLPLVLVLACISSAQAATSQLFRPEKDKANGEVIRNEDPTAWDGEYASNNKDYNPLFAASTSGVEGENLIIWARLRGYAVQVKAVMENDTQVELQWSWDKPAEWQWVKLGSYTRDQLGRSFLIIRGPDAAANAGLDAVLLTSDATLDPKSLTQAELQAKIGTSTKTAELQPYR